MMPKLLREKKSLVRLDGLGALVSACLLGLVLPRFETVFGVPPEVLRVLAGIACLLALFSFGSLLAGWPRTKTVLTILAISNFYYCCLTVGLLLAVSSAVTVWGWAYFVGELAIVLPLARWEWKQRKS